MTKVGELEKGASIWKTGGCLTEYFASGLNVLVLTADYPPRAWSGIAAAASNHALALADAGANVSVLTRFRPPSSVAATSPRLQVRGLDEPTFPYRGAAFDWIHLHSLAFTELAFEIQRRHRARIAYTAHSIILREIEDGPVRRYWSALQLRLMQECNAVILVSESERQALFSVAPEIARRAHVIANAVAPPVSSAASFKSGGPVVFAGRFTAQKGTNTLRQLLPSLRTSWRGHYVVAGGHGDAEGNQMIANLQVQLGDALSLLGWLNRQDLDRLFSVAALVLVPSNYEPFGMVALEAMRMGAPVLASSVGGLAETVTSESGGRLVERHDPEAWRNHALDILRDETGAGALARRGPEYVKSHFHPALTARRLMRDVYAN